MYRFVLILSFVLFSQAFGQRSRVVGGEDIPIEKVPYQISLEFNGFHKCGGSILAPNFIVTAAHCVNYMYDAMYGVSEKNFTVRAGTSTIGSGGQVFNVTKIHEHPNWDPFRIDNDLAILELNGNLEYNDKVQPITLPTRDQSWPAGTEALASGWGILDEENVELVNLTGVYINIIRHEECVEDYGNIVTDNMLCAGVEEGGKGVCYRDSGGPLQVDGVLVGVVNFTRGCAEVGWPGVFVNVTVFRDFFEEVTGL